MSEEGPAAETKGAGTNAQAVGIWTGAWEESGVDIWLCREGQRKKKLERTWKETQRITGSSSGLVTRKGK